MTRFGGEWNDKQSWAPFYARTFLSYQPRTVEKGTEWNGTE